MGINELKEYLRIDDDASDTLIQALQISAEEYLLNAGVAKDYSKMLYGLAVKMLVTSWFENRETGGKKDLSSLSLQSIIIQLR
ncbi:MAG: hypothetical protein K0R93_1038 [Anaerosolibacter sp.]|jgi:uncharacterized phage protein (predicted DNA packaging)|uniref:head-tail connector protein n=1 Tax=Anaerosolibacter sp. TaxID=1872527 RepID=UPI002625BD9F|nr:head-tail connector protein [Anaerosolibacter sp.]MDF2546140.1 hypothetical protein [Anaerosolibacter sp.]